MAALFSALCLALAAFARSTKEGQYYLMPLLLVTMPLMMLPMSPGVELEPGQQPDSGHRRDAAAAVADWKATTGSRRCRTCRRWWR